VEASPTREYDADPCARSLPVSLEISSHVPLRGRGIPIIIARAMRVSADAYKLDRGYSFLRLVAK
jgi:hypothetical protein